MSVSKSFFYKIRKSPLLRTIISLSLVFIIILTIVLYKLNTQSIPHIEACNPPVSESKEKMTITGINFGQKRPDSYVELCGDRITTSSYLTWSDNQIVLVLPSSIEDGLLYVKTPQGRSNPMIFTSKNTVPIPILPDPETSIPAITSLSTIDASVGDVISINGNNFGTSRNSSSVFITAKNDKTRNDEFLCCSEQNNDYLFWSDHEIQIRIPDGAQTGFLYVQTTKGDSNKSRIQISSSAGFKNYSDKHTYLVSLSADIDDIQTTDISTITLFIPYPPVSSWQRKVEIVDLKPAPTIPKYTNTIIHQFLVDSQVMEKQTVQDTFAITIYEVQSSIKTTAISTNQNGPELFPLYVKADSVVPSNDPRITELIRTIVQKQTNPYLKARLIYNYLIKNISLLQDSRPAQSDVLSALETGSGDAYDFAILYTALARATGIPTLPIAGILLNTSLQTRNHWWVEFYLDGIGWIPVDPAMGAGLEYEIFQPKKNPNNFYFGNLDSQHIAFSRGCNNIKSAQQSVKKVFRPKTYSLQSIWEEASDSTLEYSSWWGNVIVQGVY